MPFGIYDRGKAKSRWSEGIDKLEVKAIIDAVKDNMPLLLTCETHGIHGGWRIQGRALRCKICDATRAKKFTKDNYFKYLILWASKRKHKIDIDADFLEYLWNQQERKCALSGAKLIFRDDCSLDRKDSSEGYTRSNVQLVLREINSMKSNLSDYRFVELCKMVAMNNSY